MNALCLFGNLRSPPNHAVLLNALRMAAVSQCGLTILIDAYTRTLDHSYLDVLGFKSKLREHVQQDADFYIASTYDQLLTLIEDEQLDVIVSVECFLEPSWERRLTDVLNESGSEWLLLDYSKPTERHPIFSKLAKLPVSILLMRDQKWKNKPVLLAALDPLHRHDRPATMDPSIVRIADALSSRFTTGYKIVHCCHITPYLVKYAKQIMAIHSDALRKFRAMYKLDGVSVVLIPGNPEQQLPEYARKARCDILVMGGFCRSSMSNFWLGSTTEAVVQAMPCDILLVKSD
ncbi:universal stress protein [Photobacterium sp.]|uniref:universal stress protein n=1 Tax=Photobacterium sp. TaxID=660 RepID=UPI00299EE21B|nr:universal stress protein [Photobacterium sp.]MDX1302963.1 universal stress protein [Photobacterium sp.]